MQILLASEGREAHRQFVVHLESRRALVFFRKDEAQTGEETETDLARPGRYRGDVGTRSLRPDLHEDAAVQKIELFRRNLRFEDVSGQGKRLSVKNVDLGALPGGKPHKPCRGERG